MRRPILLLATMVLAGIALSGCAVPPAASGPSPQLERDFAKMQQDQQNLASKLDRIQSNLMLIEARVQDQQQMLEQLRQGEATQKVTPGGQKTGQTVAPPPPTPQAAGGAPSPTEIYLKAFSDSAAGRYTEAISGFTAFLKAYPDSDFAGNARYWLGECYFAQQQYPQAVAAFQQVVERTPEGTKAPDALLKMAAALKQMGQNDRAGQALQALRQRDPDSAAAKKSLDEN